MDKQPDTLSSKPSARRKLIRGSLSLPAVLAVHNGSALAANSNQFRCANNYTEALADRKAPTAGPADGFVRVNRYLIGGKYFVKVSDVTAKASAIGLSYTGDAGTNYGGTFYIRWSSGTGGPSGGSPSLDSTNLVAVEFKNAGTVAAPNYSVTGIVREGAAVSTTEKKSAISNSCWNSIK